MLAHSLSEKPFISRKIQQALRWHCDCIPVFVLSFFFLLTVISDKNFFFLETAFILETALFFFLFFSYFKNSERVLFFLLLIHLSDFYETQNLNCRA